MMETIRFHADFELWSDTIALRAKSKDGMAARLEFAPHEEGMTSEPFVRLSMESAQELANALWAAGVRPAQGRNSEGVTAAQGAHLQDMRALAFAKLGVSKP